MFIISRYWKGFKSSPTRVKYYQGAGAFLLIFIFTCHYNWFETAFKEVFIYSKDGQWCPRCSPQAFISHQLINLTDQFIINKPNICDSASPLALIMIISSAKSRNRREAIRQTWLKYAGQRDMVVLFGLGSKPGDDTEILLEDEISQDIIQWPIVDDWRNLTLKTIASLSWFKTYCSQAKFFIKVDDDAVLNVNNLFTYLNSFATSNSIVGHLLRHNSPCFAWWRQRHCMPIQDHRKIDYLNHYPPYPAGPMYVMTKGSVIQLINYAKNVSRRDIYFLEDVYITLLAREIGLNLIDNERFTFCQNLSERNFLTKVINSIVIYDCSPKQFDTIWSIISQTK